VLCAAGVVDPRAWLWTGESLTVLADGLGLAGDGVRRIVDLGCGWGGLGLALALAAPSVRLEGLDLEPQLIGCAREIASQLRLGRRVRFSEADAESYDGWTGDTAVVCQAVLVHQPRPCRWLQRRIDGLPAGAHVAVVEEDVVATARAVVDSLTDDDPSYGEQRIEVARAVAAGALRSLAVDRRLGREPGEVLRRCGLTGVHELALPGALDPRDPHDPDGDASSWLRQKLTRRLRDDDLVERSLAEAGGMSPARHEAWCRRQRRADRGRLQALDAGGWRRAEGAGYRAAWGIRAG
jgi:SAM-dependent methyltransferase